MKTFIQFLVESNEYESLKKHRKPLTSEEREECLKAKAVWHHGPKGEATPAVWKSNNKNKTTYVTNTHRAWNKATSLTGAIKKYHDFIKGTS